MKLYSINTGHFKLDGGAMFGVVPKSIWNKLNPADENNMCSWAMRSLLIEDGNRLMLVDNGIGDKQDERFFSYYYLHGEDTLDKSLARYGFHRADITDVFLTHLHFDHCGGSIMYNADRSKLVPAFPNAIYWSHPRHWEAAIHPNPREKASFLRENILPIQENGQLQWIDKEGEWLPNISVYVVDGHTDAMMLPVIKYKDTEVIFMADLVPSYHHIKVPYVMGYDSRPLEAMKEKEKILGAAVKANSVLFFEHDPINECAYVQLTDRGIIGGEKFLLSEI